ncbi:MAG: phosphatidylserine/phosphatidylglycerophosphate/cardiolipin synthase family protein [Gammaproteobacteria bacterium]|nr:phosphatidylserine/phosphatidylglycerophosphate/cardiolipin synthase family protein [Gammaproteobacteria bacterium]
MIFTTTPRYQFPWRANNRFELFIDGQQFYPDMLAQIQHAQHSILLEQYLVVSGRVVTQFVEAIQGAVRRGVQVYILLDDYGARALSPADRQRLLQSALHCHFYNPFRWSALYQSLRRDHRKLLIIDGQTAFVGGAGLADSFMYPSDNLPAWHDVVVKMQGAVVADWHHAFTRAWQQATGQIPLMPNSVFKPVAATQPGQVQLADGLLNNEIIRAAVSQIKKSRQRIWIATPYFVTTHKLRRQLRAAARRGVDVRLLLPGEYNDHPWITHVARRHYLRLLYAGVQIFEYQPRFIHAKLILCDNWVSIGSSNLDRWNQRWNHDANVAIQDAVFTQRVMELFQQDFANSKPISLQLWRQRPWRQHWREIWHGYKVLIIHWVGYWLTQHHRHDK